MEKIYPTDEHTDIEYSDNAVRPMTELEKAQCEIKILNRRIKKMQDEIAYCEDVSKEYLREADGFRIELNAIKWTLETVFRRGGNG